MTSQVNTFPTHMNAQVQAAAPPQPLAPAPIGHAPMDSQPSIRIMAALAATARSEPNEPSEPACRSISTTS